MSTKQKQLSEYLINSIEHYFEGREMRVGKRRSNLNLNLRVPQGSMLGLTRLLAETATPCEVCGDR